MTCDNCKIKEADKFEIEPMEYLGKKIPAGQFCSSQCMGEFISQIISE